MKNTTKETPRKITLSEDRLPRAWYNILADLRTPVGPPLHPATMEPIRPEDLSPLFPMALIEQEVSEEAEIPIPDEVREALAIWRPTPLVRAVGLERLLNTPARVFYKNESVSPPGSHKPNTAVAQAHYNKAAGVNRLTTETGAGQWGSALSFASALFGLECTVFMVRASFEQKPYRKVMMETWGGRCVPSPSCETNAGRAILERLPDTPGSLGIAISEAVEAALAAEDTKYALGSVLNHVLLHQTVIGLEALEQLDSVGAYPDVVIGCVGGGSNFAGLALPFVRDKIAGRELRIIGVEPTSCPSMTKGPFAYDYGDTAKTTPLMPMHTLGHDFVPEPIHAGGLRYHGVAPIVSRLVEDELVAPVAVDQLESFAAGVLFARTEGIIPAPETSHALAVAIREAERARQECRPVNIVVSFSGHGLVDLKAYEHYLSGRLKTFTLSDEEVRRGLASMEGLPPAE